MEDLGVAVREFGMGGLVGVWGLWELGFEGVGMGSLGWWFYWAGGSGGLVRVGFGCVALWLAGWTGGLYMASLRRDVGVSLQTMYRVEVYTWRFQAECWIYKPSWRVQVEYWGFQINYQDSGGEFVASGFSVV